MLMQTLHIVHGGKHILRGECVARYPCGYCGRESCHNKLCAPNKIGNAFYYVKVESNCPYFIQHARKVKKSSNRYPWTNYLEKCALCKADVWTYNGKNHYNDMHPKVACPQIDPEELKIMLKK